MQSISRVPTPPTPHDRYPIATGESDSGLPKLDLRELLAALRRNVWLILAVTAVSTVAGFFLSSGQTTIYRAAAVLRMEDPRRALAGQFDGGFVDWLMWRTNPMVTESAVLRENVELAASIADREGLRLTIVSEDFSWSDIEGVAVASAAEADTLTLRFFPEHLVVRGRRQLMEGTYGSAMEIEGVRFTIPRRPDAEFAQFRVISRDAAAGRVLSGISAVPRAETNLIDLTYTANDPRLAQKVVNAAAEEFQAYNFDRQRQISVQRRAFIEEQIEQMGAHLNEAYRALSDFRRANQIYGTQEGMSTVQTTLQTLDQRREELQAERAVAQSLIEKHGARGSESDSREWYWSVMTAQGIGSSPIIAPLYGQLEGYAQEREQLVAGEWGSWTGHPEVQRLDGLIAATEARMVEALENHIMGVDARIAALDELKSGSLESLDALSGTELEETWLLHEVNTIRGIMEQLGAEHQRARISEAVEMPQFGIVSRATTPGSPRRSDGNRAILLGIVAGLMLGSGGAFLRESMNTTIRRREEIEAIFGVPGLGVIPRITPLAPRNRFRLLGLNVRQKSEMPPEPEPDTPESLGLVTTTDQLSSAPEAYRVLRTNLTYSHGEDELRTVLVTSPSAGEGKTTTAANLAVTFAQQGLRVALVDCDLRRPRMHDVFSLPKTPGLAEALTGTHLLAGILHSTPVPGLHVITAGAFASNPADLLSLSRMGALIGELREQFDVVLLDSPPILAASDSTILGIQVDGTLMVVRAGRTDRGAAQHAMRQLTSVGSRVVGVVLNDPDETVPHYYYYYPSHA